MSPNLEKFVDRLPLAEKIRPVREEGGIAYYEVTMEEFWQKLHRDLRPTRLWGYNRSFPGPLFDVPHGKKIRVKWTNHLPQRHFLPMDTTILDEMGTDFPEVRTVVHLHGGETEPDSDGYPEAWFTRDFNKTGPDFKKEVYEYTNSQRPATLWYHDHAIGITRLNVYAGLAGMYIIRDPKEKAFHLPSGKYEIPLLLTDRTFNNDGSLFYPRQPQNPGPETPDPSVVPFFLGDTILVNGKVWPYLEVEPRKYRFRIVNASNTRAYRLYLDSGQAFYQIGTDGGLLRRPVQVENLALEPAERADLILDFSEYAGQTILLKNDLGPNADPADQTGDVMQFRVVLPVAGEDTSRIPRSLSSIPVPSSHNVSAIRHLKLTGATDSYGRPLLLLDKKRWMDPVTETPRLGTTEIWSLANTTAFTHPIHIHLIQFQILDRRPFDLDLYNETGQIVYTGPATPPEPNERGFKDTVAAPGGQITRVMMRFSPYAGDYVWHCHILEHEDYDMMRPFQVIDPDLPASDGPLLD
ncbi:multicopper oxidase [Weizmannia coagulans]|uniref:Laccase n=3 Tax=Heyndrickxia TaxID=2837504 RepID=G2TN02_HEYCO|nr:MULTISPECIES: multicopper oxidase [Heyndrickxia]AEP01225.1 multicopper oxidase type 2 [Heyndrickxia coagulans 36D1]AJO21674.1 multicopper oxidase type 2 [Heyndrickxia coagulans]AKN52717.1 Spore coat protein A [Heyndrickxia coagulans]ATW82186.1 copper oxidase [Heyndrickxia coagulans]AVD57150.1 copper oxidase [Heyndrickxia coagulans]